METHPLEEVASDFFKGIRAFDKVSPEMMSTALIQNKKGPTEQGLKFLSQQYHLPHIPKLTRNDLVVINAAG
jgi:hypothetical protein